MELTTLLILLASMVATIICSGMFSAAETSMMALNRYRLRHLAEKKHRGA
ncbi:MAG: Cyclin transrane N-terminal domain, partial [Pseudomonadota bacterium]